MSQSEEEGAKMMAKRKNNKGRKPQAKKGKELQAIYDRVRREFSAADLQKYTRIQKGIPLEKVIERMEAIHFKTGSRIT